MDSKNRSEQFGNAYSLYLPDVIHGVTRVDLVSARVPNTMYNLSNGSNDIKYNGTTLAIPPGFYSATTLSTYIGYASAVGGVQNLTVEYLAGEGKFIFYQNSNFTINVLSQEMSLLLGLPIGQYTGINNSPYYINHPTYGSKYVIKSQNVINLSVNEYLFLDIEELRTQYTLDTKSLNGLPGIFDGTTMARSFAMVPMDIASGGIKCFKEHTDYIMSIVYTKPIDSLAKLTIRWVDKDGSVVSFNGVDNNSFTLRIFSNH